jgi:hypothetical protein
MVTSDWPLQLQPESVEYGGEITALDEDGWACLWECADPL